MRSSRRAVPQSGPSRGVPRVRAKTGACLPFGSCYLSAMRWNSRSARARMCRNLAIATGEDDKMKKINRRTFAKATGALFAVPAFAGFPAAMAQAQNNSDLRVDKDIVFGKGGDIDLLLDVYHPPEGVTPKR